MHMFFFTGEDWVLFGALVWEHGNKRKEKKTCNVDQIIKYLLGILGSFFFFFLQHSGYSRMCFTTQRLLKILSNELFNRKKKKKKGSSLI